MKRDDHNDIMAFTPSDIGYQSFDLSPAARFEVASMMTIAEEYHYKKIYFESFDDDILTLRYAEEKCPSQKLGSQKESLPLQFDLLESKRIQVKGAEFEVVSATAHMLVVKMVKELVLSSARLLSALRRAKNGG